MSGPLAAHVHPRVATVAGRVRASVPRGCGLCCLFCCSSQMMTVRSAEHEASTCGARHARGRADDAAPQRGRPRRKWRSRQGALSCKAAAGLAKLRVRPVQLVNGCGVPLEALRLLGPLRLHPTGRLVRHLSHEPGSMRASKHAPVGAPQQAASALHSPLVRLL